MKLLAYFTHWLGRQFLSLLVITLILIVGGYLYSGIQAYLETSHQKSVLEAGQSRLNNLQLELEAQTKRQVESVDKKSRDALDRRISEIGRQMNGLESKRRTEFERKMAFVKGDFAQDFEVDLRIDLLKQEREHLVQAKGALDGIKALAEGKAELSRRQIRSRSVYDQLVKARYQIEVLVWNNPYQSQIPGTQAYQNLKLLQAQDNVFLQQNQYASDAYWSLKRRLDALEKTQQLPPFVLTRTAYEKVDADLQDQIAQKKAELAKNWISCYVDPALNVLPTALLILVATILSPLAIKGVFYYVIAPLAARRKAIQLIAESNGDIHFAKHANADGRNISSVSWATTVRTDEELLVHPEYLRSTAENSVKSTKWLLNNSYPLTSIASGLYALTRLRGDSEHTHTIAAIEDPLAEVAELYIPAGSQLVMQPKHVVGIIQPRNQPLRIESKWRLNSVTAWLTLQLRYLVFSGPARILVKGCRGVRVDHVGNGQSINQAATIGFSSNLSYSVSRSAPFVAYVRGKQELFDDKFAGKSGYYISEELPNLGKKSGITGKGLEGLTDSALKVFGV